MPHFLVHGFRWHRIGVIKHVANFIIDDASSEWVHTGSPSGKAVLDSLNNLYPDLFESLDSHDSDITLIEQYDGQSDETGYKQPYVYVCDYVERMKGLSMDVGDIAGKWDIADGPSERLVKLRDCLQADERISLWIVHCADEVRQPPTLPKDGDASSTATVTQEDKVPDDEAKEKPEGNSPKDTALGEKPLPQVPPDKCHEAEVSGKNEENAVPKARSPLLPIRSLFRKKSRKFKP